MKGKYMRWLIILLILSVIGNAVGLFIAYKFYKADKALKINQNMIEALNKHLSKKLLFLHHSVGSIWLNEGNLKAALMANGFAVHDATYGDEIGQETDVCHWVPKFQKDMDKILKFDQHPNGYYSDGTENDIIMFKSCYPNSNIVDEGEGPGDPLDKTRTIANYKAVFDNLKETFKKYPDKKFIYVTAPPLVPAETTPDKTVRARKFNEWLKLEFVPQYREETGLNNFYVFDFFDVLSDEQNYLKKEFRFVETDSHPNGAAGIAATAAFIEFLNENNI